MLEHDFYLDHEEEEEEYIRSEDCSELTTLLWTMSRSRRHREIEGEEEARIQQERRKQGLATIHNQIC